MSVTGFIRLCTYSAPCLRFERLHVNGGRTNLLWPTDQRMIFDAVFISQPADQLWRFVGAILGVISPFRCSISLHVSDTLWLRWWGRARRFGRWPISASLPRGVCDRRMDEGRGVRGPLQLTFSFSGNAWNCVRDVSIRCSVVPPQRSSVGGSLYVHRRLMASHRCSY